MREFTAAFDDRLDELKTLHVDDVGPALALMLRARGTPPTSQLGWGFLPPKTVWIWTTSF